MIHAPASWPRAWRSPSRHRAWRLWLAAGAAAAAADPLGDRVRHRDLRHALHRDGRADALPARDRRPRPRRRFRPTSSRSWSRSSPSGVGHVPAVPGAGSARARRNGRRRSERRSPPARAAGRRLSPRRCGAGEQPQASPESAAAATRRSAARAARRAASRAICRSSATAPRISSRSTTSSRSTPTRTTPTSSTAPRSCSARCAISDVEARLDRSRFVRVHRSHIVNIDRVVGLKRAGDNGLIELAGRRPLHRAGQPQPVRLAEVAVAAETCARASALALTVDRPFTSAHPDAVRAERAAFRARTAPARARSRCSCTAARSCGAQLSLHPMQKVGHERCTGPVGRLAGTAPGGMTVIPGSFAYHRPTSVDEAVALLADLGEEARPLAGGHSLIPMMKLRLADARRTSSTSAASPTSRASARTATTS